jgi:hypothetical protein
MTKPSQKDQEFINIVMNMSDEKITQLFADMGIEIDLNKPFPQGSRLMQDLMAADDEDEGYLLDEY